MKTWQGRIVAGSHTLFEHFTSSVTQDRRLAPYDVRVSQSHARALARAGIISEDDADLLAGALDRIGQEIESGELVWRDDLEDVHTHVESRLRELLGDVADMLHTGRSRNDQIAADLRLFVKDAALEIRELVLQLEESFIGLADRYHSALMPGYTHLQQAQPVLIAQPLLAYCSMLGRDWERFGGVIDRANLSPLGSGALAGAGFPLDRLYLAEQCGFAGIVANSMDAVSDRDFLVEFVSAAGLCMTHLSRMAEDLIFWSSTEAGFVRLPDSFASGSSMMPQKKNPDVLELVRGRTALVLGDVAAALALVKGLPLTYNRDLQEDKTPLFHSADMLAACLKILAAMAPELIFDTERTETSLSRNALATDLADHLVRNGMPFRQAHALVAQLVEQCASEGQDIGDLSPQELAAALPAHVALPDLSPENSVRARQTTGSTSPDSVNQQIAALRELVQNRRTNARP